jgi:hypothetical protein
MFRWVTLDVDHDSMRMPLQRERLRIGLLGHPDDAAQDRAAVERRDGQQVEDGEAHVHHDQPLHQLAKARAGPTTRSRRGSPRGRRGGCRGPREGHQDLVARRSRKLEIRIMTGLPHPMKAKPPRNTKMLISGMITVPTRSRCGEGIERHAAVGAGRVVPQQVGHDGVAPLVEADARDEHDEDDEPVADENGVEIHAAAISLARGQLGDQLLLLRVQVGIGHRAEHLRAWAPCSPCL